MSPRAARRVAATFLAAAPLMLGACTDDVFVDPAPPLPSSLDVAYSFAAGGAGEAFDKADALAVRMTRGETAVLDTLIPFSPRDPETRVRLAIDIEQDEEAVHVAFELRRAEAALFRGEHAINLRRGQVTAVQVVLEPVVAGVLLPDEVPTITAIGDTVALHGVAVFATGDTIPGFPLAWSSSNTDVVTVQPDGRVIARGEGQAIVRAQAGAFRDSVNVVVAAIVEQVTIDPPAATIPVASTRRFEAVARDRRGNALERTIVWSSSDTLVAKVDQTGLVAANAVGEADITAQAEDVSATARVTVQPVGSIAITGITRAGTSTPVQPDNVSGRIDVAVSASAPAGVASRIEVLADTVVFCASTFTGGSTTTTCTVDTGRFDPATGAVSFLNGQHTVSARIIGTGGHTLNSASAALTFRNADGFYGTITGTRGPAADSAGRQWIGGDITITAVPVLYSGGTVTQATIRLPDLFVRGASRAITRTATPSSPGAPLTFTLPADRPTTDGGVAEVNTGPAGSRPVIVSSVLAGGSAGPSGAFLNNLDADTLNDAVARIDNEAPRPGIFVLPEPSGTIACCLNNWVGRNHAFVLGKTGHDDAPFGIAGVDSIRITVHAGSASLTDSQLVALAPVTTGAGLNPTTRNDVYRAVALVRDNLGNATLVRLTPNPANPGGTSNSATFGVDHRPPIAAFGTSSLRDGARFNNANPPNNESFSITAQDSLSGLGPQPVAVRLLRHTPTGGLACAVGQVDLETNECMPGLDDLVLPLPPLDGYLIYQAVVRDRAGNESDSLIATVLVDRNAPAFSGLISVPANPTGGASTTFSVGAVDDLDLEQAQLRIRYGANEDLPFGAPTPLGTFGPPFTTSATASATINFVRSIEHTLPGGAPSGTVEPAVSASFTVLDVAGNAGTIFEALNNVPAGTSASQLGVTSFALTAPSPGTQVCNGEGAAGTCATSTSVTLRAEATGPAGFANPFARVHFYRVDANGTVHLIGTATSATADNSGGVRTWRWTITFAPTGLPAQDPAPIFAIGVDAQGDGLVSGSVDIEIVDGR